MTSVAFVVALALPLVAGAALLSALSWSHRREPLAFVGAAFPAGALVTGLLVFAWMAARLPLAGGGLQVALALVSVALVALGRWRRRRAPELELAAPRVPGFAAKGAARAAGELVFAVLLFLALSEVAFHALDNVHVPIDLGDSATIWTMRAKMLFHHGAIDERLTETLNRASGAGHLDYPLLNPFLQVWVMSTEGRLLEWPLRIPTHLWHASLVVTTFAVARARVGALLGAPLAWLYLSLTSLRTIAEGTMMDLAVALAFLLLVDRIARHLEGDRTAPQLALAALWAAVLVWTKNEGTMLLAATGAALVLGIGRVGRLRRREWLAVVVAPALILLLQGAFNRHFGFENDLMTGGQPGESPSVAGMVVENLPARGPVVLSFFADIAVSFGRSRHLFVLYLLALVLGGGLVWRAPSRFVTLAIGIGWAGYFAAFVMSFRDVTWHMQTSAGRVTSHLMGAIVLLLALVVRDFLLAGRPAASRASSTDEPAPSA